MEKDTVAKNTNTNTNTNNLFPPFPMRYNKVHNVNTVLNNKAQLKRNQKWWLRKRHDG